jgi:hypothetical protein
MAKLSKKYSQFLFVTIMVTMMVFSVSLFITLISVGLVSNFIEIWARAYMMGFAIAFPTAHVVVRIARKIVATITA